MPGRATGVPEPDGFELVIEGAHAFDIGLDRRSAGFGVVVWSNATMWSSWQRAAGTVQ